jgi:hypothetical protein
VAVSGRRYWLLACPGSPPERKREDEARTRGQWRIADDTVLRSPTSHRRRTVVVGSVLASSRRRPRPLALPRRVLAVGLLCGFRFSAGALRQTLGSRLAIPFFERLVRDLAFDKQLREFALPPRASCAAASLPAVARHQPAEACGVPCSRASTWRNGRRLDRRSAVRGGRGASASPKAGTLAGYGANAGASFVSSFPRQSSRGSAASRANVHIRTRSESAASNSAKR